MIQLNVVVFIVMFEKYFPQNNMHIFYNLTQNLDRSYFVNNTTCKSYFVNNTYKSIFFL